MPVHAAAPGPPLPSSPSLVLLLGMEPAAFCSQECFKGSWTEHKKVHKPSALDGWHYCTRPDFKWPGDLRPARINGAPHCCLIFW